MKSAIPLFITCFFLMIISLADAQTVEIIRQSEFQPPPTVEKDFAFIEPVSDSTNFTFVATLKASAKGKQSGIDFLYYKLKEKAQALGANSFKLVNYQKDDSNGTSSLILHVYFAIDSLLNENFEHHAKNVVYIFGSMANTDKASSFKIDNTKKELKGGSWYKQLLNKDQEIKINKGGFTGSTTWIKWKEDRPATFLALTGFGLGGGPLPPGVVGMSFNTGRINYVDGDLGLLLTVLLREGE